MVPCIETRHRKPPLRGGSASTLEAGAALHKVVFRFARTKKQAPYIRLRAPYLLTRFFEACGAMYLPCTVRYTHGPAHDALYTTLNLHSYTQHVTRFGSDHSLL